MSADDYFVPGALDALRRENELLSLENNYLKGRIAGLELELERVRRPGTPAPAPPSVAEPSRDADGADSTEP